MEIGLQQFFIHGENDQIKKLIQVRNKGLETLKAPAKLRSDDRIFNHLCNIDNVKFMEAVDVTSHLRRESSFLPNDGTSKAFVLEFTGSYQSFTTLLPYLNQLLTFVILATNQTLLCDFLSQILTLLSF